MEQEGRKRGTGVETQAPGMEGGSLGQESLSRESCVRGGITRRKKQMNADKAHTMCWAFISQGPHAALMDWS